MTILWCGSKLSRGSRLVWSMAGDGVVRAGTAGVDAGMGGNDGTRELLRRLLREFN